jgi:hydroxyacylglutathione hydrolase
MLAKRLILGPLEVNCWLVGDDFGGPVLVIDPADDALRIRESVGERGIAAVVLTHNHFDHIGAVRDLIAASGAPLLIHRADAAGLATAEGTGGAQFGFDHTAPEPDRTLEDGDVVESGELRLTVLHTPGHTPGGICLFADAAALAAAGAATGSPPHVFTGDTLFAGSVGRSDFAGGDGRALATAIARKLAPLPAETIVHPGHGPDTTIGRERKVNPFFPRA